MVCFVCYGLVRWDGSFVCGMVRIWRCEVDQVQIGALKELEERDGTLRPEAIVEAAKGNNHPLHNEFPWNDKEAAQLHRIQIARRIIGAYRVVIQVTDAAYTVQARGYVHDPTAEPDEARYISADAIRPESKKAKAVLLTEARRAASIIDNIIGLSEKWTIDNRRLRTAKRDVSSFIKGLE
jgi:hypothetical protein